MNRDDIIRMARESGFEVDEEGEILESDKWHTQTIFVERFAALVAEAEREACIRDCDGVDLVGADDCIAAIRARGQG